MLAVSVVKVVSDAPPIADGDGNVMIRHAAILLGVQSQDYCSFDNMSRKVALMSGTGFVAYQGAGNKFQEAPRRLVSHLALLCCF